MDDLAFQSVLETAHAYDWFMLIGSTTILKKCGVNEYAGKCPRCGGKDRFHLNTQKGFFCRQCTGGLDGGWKDQITFRMWLLGETFMDAFRFFDCGHKLTRQEIAQIAAERERREQIEQEAIHAKQIETRNKLDSSNVWQVYSQNLKENPGARDLWRSRGLSDEWQDYYGVGYCPRKEFYYDDQPFTTETLTIPYHEARADGLHNPTYHTIGLVHRLLTPPDPGDKYRPHLSGAGKALYRADYLTVGLERTALLVEGEIKAMVTFSHLHDSQGIPLLPDLSVIATAGANLKPELIAQLAGVERIWICLDPDANGQADHLARVLGKDRAKVIRLPEKIDDLFNMGVMTAERLIKLLS